MKVYIVSMVMKINKVEKRPAGLTVHVAAVLERTQQEEPLGFLQLAGGFASLRASSILIKISVA
jgi:hypothetical protein